MSRNAYQRWQQGATAVDIPRHECVPLAEFLMERHQDAYSNPRHLDHQAISETVQELYKRGAPGYVGPSGEVCDGADLTNRESLMR